LEDLPPQIGESSKEGVIRIDVGTSMAEAEKLIIRGTLASLNNNKSRAAEILGIGRKTLHRKIHDYGLEEDFLKKS
jgi:DNA-binding NtrC family response regulator